MVWTADIYGSPAGHPREVIFRTQPEPEDPRAFWLRLLLSVRIDPDSLKGKRIYLTGGADF